MQKEHFEKLTGVSLQSLLAFNERRLERIAGHDEQNRIHVQGRIDSLKAQIKQSEQTASVSKHVQ